MKVYSAWWNPFPGSTGWLMEGGYELYIDYNNIDLNSGLKKVFVQVEGPDIGGCRGWLEENHKHYVLIIGWDEWMFKHLPQEKMRFLPMGCDGWLYPGEYNTDYEKRFEVSFLLSNQRKTEAHELKWQLWDKRKEIVNIPVREYETTGFHPNGHIDWRQRFEKLYQHCQFSLWFENHKLKNFFTERIMDCFLSKTIPIYYGCPNIGDFFDANGVFAFNTVSEAIEICNSLTPDTYNSKLESINKNWQIAKERQEGKAWFTGLNNYIKEIL